MNQAYPLIMTSETKFELHLDVENNHTTTVDLLSSHCQLSKQRIKQAMKNGSTWLSRNNQTSRIRRTKKVLLPGDKIHLYFDSKIQTLLPAPPTIIEDNKSYSIWYKPKGMYSQGSKWGDHCSISRWVETHLKPQRPSFSIHRLDRATSGLMVVAHTKKTATFLAQQFENRKVQKKYLAVTASHSGNPSFTIDEDIDRKKAISHFQLIKYQEPYSLFEVIIETGRKHQIRKHLATLNMPIVGDRLYGQNNVDTMKNQADLQLTAYSLSFLCPIEKTNKTWILPEEYHPTLKALLGT